MADSFRKYSERVTAYLRETYGVADAKVNQGGKHPFITVRYGERDHRITLRHDGGFKGFDLKCQDIRAALGPPPSQGETTMPETSQGFEAADSAVAFAAYTDSPADEPQPESIKVPAPIRGTVVGRRGNKCCDFRFPLSASPFAVGDHISAERYGEGWRIFRLPSAKSKVRCEHSRAIVTVLHRRIGMTPDLPLTEAEFLVSDDQVLVNPLSDISAYLLDTSIMRNISSDQAVIPPLYAPNDVRAFGAVPDAPVWSADRIREVLAAVRKIEAETPYRLARKDNGTLSFYAEIE